MMEPKCVELSPDEWNAAMTARETDEWNLRVNKPLIAWSLEKPGTMLIHDHAIYAALAMIGLSMLSAAVLAVLILARVL